MPAEGVKGARVCLLLPALHLTSLFSSASLSQFSTQTGCSHVSACAYVLMPSLTNHQPSCPAQSSDQPSSTLPFSLTIKSLCHKTHLNVITQLPAYLTHWTELFLDRNPIISFPPFPQEAPHGWLQGRVGSRRVGERYVGKYCFA